MKNQPIELSQNLKDEYEQLLAEGIITWLDLRQITDTQIHIFSSHSRGTTRNFKRIRSMAELICEINALPSEAALLMHAGFATIEAIARATPEELVEKVGRLERVLITNSSGQSVNLRKANSWIQLAQGRQINN